jgi:hypothetical protein
VFLIIAAAARWYLHWGGESLLLQLQQGWFKAVVADPALHVEHDNHT